MQLVPTHLQRNKIKEHNTTPISLPLFLTSFVSDQINPNINTAEASGGCSSHRLVPECAIAAASFSTDQGDALTCKEEKNTFTNRSVLNGLCRVGLRVCKTAQISSYRGIMRRREGDGE